MDFDSILTPAETELYVSNIQPTSLDQLGTESWFEAHERLQRLYQQATLEASKHVHEQVKDDILSHQKLQILVHEAILISIWKQKILPRILKTHPEAENTFPIYIVFYHEATVIGLLQTLLYHSECCECLDDSAVELVDYCIFILTRIAISTQNKEDWEPNKKQSSPLQELSNQERNLLFGIGSSCLSIVRYLIESLDSVPVTVASRLYSDNDVPLLISQLIDQEAWTRTDFEGETYKHEGGDWRKTSDLEEMTKTEAQLWLTMHQLLLNKHISNHYEFTESRRNRLGKLSRFLHELLVDQLPPLLDLKQWLAHLSVSQLPSTASRKSFIVELSSQFRNGLELRYDGRWDELAEKHARLLIDVTPAEMQRLAASLSNAFDSIADVADDGPRCANCGQSATQKCSSCKNEWYCGRPCQVKQWKNHKPVCSVVNEATKS